jgi:hypothetical protein
MARHTSVKISTLDLAALAYAAIRANNGQTYKDDRFYDKTADTVISVVPNKVLMREGKLVVTDQDRADAAAAIDTLTKDRTLRILKNLKVADFQNTLTNLVVGTDATMSDAGLMAFLPSMADQIRQRQQREEEISVLAYTSEYLGREGDKVTFTLTVMTARWNQQFNCWTVNGKDDNGNLISYFTSKEECTRNGIYTAKIKRIEQSHYHNGAKVTTVNFVKPR